MPVPANVRGEEGNEISVPCEKAAGLRLTSGKKEAHALFCTNLFVIEQETQERGMRRSLYTQSDTELSAFDHLRYSVEIVSGDSTVE